MREMRLKLEESDSVLMLVDTPVYNIVTGEVYNDALLPGLMSKCPDSTTFKMWMHRRYSANTNTLARRLKGIYFGQGNRAKIDRDTRAFSLSDSYWIRHSMDEEFKFLSPYYNDFWKGIGDYSGGAVPTLYVVGCLNKQWTNSKELHKYGDSVKIEAEALKFVHAAGLDCEDYCLMDDNDLCLFNMTTPELMLEQADISGRLDPDDFDNDKIVELFGKDGLNMILMDGLVANGDRHAGNFGWLRNTSTGEYVKMSPMYDFDHALDNDAESDVLISDAIRVVQEYGYVEEAKSICRKLLSSSEILHPTFVKRTRYALAKL